MIVLSLEAHQTIFDVFHDNDSIRIDRTQRIPEYVGWLIYSHTVLNTIRITEAYKRCGQYYECFVLLNSIKMKQKESLKTLQF